MYELIPVTGRSYYIQSPAKMGVCQLNDTDVILIDTGNDKDAGRRIRKVLDAQHWKLQAIYNTHSNADHIGGNQYLQRQTKCRIFAPGIECDFTNHTILEPSFLYGGYPFKELRHKFLLAQESSAEPLTKETLPEGFSLIPLPGHFFDMVGFRSPDDVVYLADCLSSRETLDKYGISFVYDVAAYLKTLEMVKELTAACFVPAHAEATEDIAPLAQYNIDRTLAAGDIITELCREPACFEVILQRVFQKFERTMSFEQYALMGSTVRSYLSWLKDSGRISARIENSMILWEAI